MTSANTTRYRPSSSVMSPNTLFGQASSLNVTCAPTTARPSVSVTVPDTVAAQPGATHATQTAIVTVPDTVAAQPGATHATQTAIAMPHTNAKKLLRAIVSLLIRAYSSA
jgi:hypothetical protein